jgi:hypothetical protein
MTYQIATFSPLLGHSFVAHTQAGAVELRLQEAVASPRRNLPEQFPTPISLIFSGPAGTALQQGNYYLDHPALGRNYWCMVPVSAANAGACRYQVLFA